MEIRSFKKLLHDAGKSPEVCGDNNADRIIRESIRTISDAVNDGHRFLSKEAAASLAATYLQFPVAEKYRIIQHLRKQQFLCISVTDYTIPSHPVQPHFPPSISTRAIVYIS